MHKQLHCIVLFRNSNIQSLLESKPPSTKAPACAGAKASDLEVQYNELFSFQGLYSITYRLCFINWTLFEGGMSKLQVILLACPLLSS